MTRFYDRHLRVIGQSLETRRIHVFELKSGTGEYVVTGTPEKPTSFVAAIRNWNRKLSATADKLSPTACRPSNNSNGLEEVNVKNRNGFPIFTMSRACYARWALTSNRNRLGCCKYRNER